MFKIVLSNDEGFSRTLDMPFIPFKGQILLIDGKLQEVEKVTTVLITTLMTPPTAFVPVFDCKVGTTHIKLRTQI